MAEKLWWQKQMRIIQYNLQSKDAPLMDCAKIAEETREMGGNVVVMNVAGGGVAWYPTEVPFHYVNEWLPKDRDILREIIEECHKRDIKVIGRIEFGSLEEETFYQKPQWAARGADGAPKPLGNDRPGMWRRLYATCPNSGFMREEVGLKMFGEAFAKYDLDGAFWMGGFGSPCWCDTCKKKYAERYGQPMPNEADKFAPDWLSSVGGETSAMFLALMQSIDPNKPFIRYYFPFDLDMGLSFKLKADNLEKNSKEGNVLCTEAQDILSLGAARLPEWSTPALRMKMGKTVKNYAPPIGIIHTSPGMDWRHASMPKAEFLYWASQVPANGGSYWTTFTGFADTIADKRMLKTIGELNRMTERVVDEMDGAESYAQVLLLSDAGLYVQGWAEALLCSHIEFDMLAHYQFSYERIKDYKVVIAPKHFQYPQGAKEILDQFLNDGGRLIVEGTSHQDLQAVADLLGVKSPVVGSEEQVSAYMRIEAPGQFLQQQVGETGFIPLRGKTGFCEALPGTQTLVTWVPSFSPVEFAGRPPERASLPAAHTDVPLCTLREYGAGKVLFLAYEPSRLIREYGMQDFYSMIDGYVRLMLGEEQQVFVDSPRRVLVSLFRKGSTTLVHLINGIGQRPLQETIPCFGLKLRFKLAGQKVKAVTGRIEPGEIRWTADNDLLTVDVARLDVWNMLKIELE